MLCIHLGPGPLTHSYHRWPCTCGNDPPHHHVLHPGIKNEMENMFSAMASSLAMPSCNCTCTCTSSSLAMPSCTCTCTCTCTSSSLAMPSCTCTCTCTCTSSSLAMPRPSGRIRLGSGLGLRLGLWLGGDALAFRSYPYMPACQHCTHMAL